MGVKHLFTSHSGTQKLQSRMSVNLNSERQFEDGNTFSIYIVSTQTTHFN